MITWSLRSPFEDDGTRNPCTPDCKMSAMLNDYCQYKRQLAFCYLQRTSGDTGVVERQGRVLAYFSTKAFSRCIDMIIGGVRCVNINRETGESDMLQACTAVMYKEAEEHVQRAWQFVSLNRFEEALDEGIYATEREPCRFRFQRFKYRIVLV